MITPDAADEKPAAEPASAATPACTVGQWVTVTRDNGIVPSMSVTWRRLGHLVASLADLDPAAPDEATRRAGVAKLDEALRSPSAAQRSQLDEPWLPV